MSTLCPKQEIFSKNNDYFTYFPLSIDIIHSKICCLKRNSLKVSILNSSIVFVKLVWISMNVQLMGICRILFSLQLASDLEKGKFGKLLYNFLNSQFTVWKFHDFSISQILREINSKDSKSQKSAPFLQFQRLWILIFINFCTF